MARGVEPVAAERASHGWEHVRPTRAQVPHPHRVSLVNAHEHVETWEIARLPFAQVHLHVRQLNPLSHLFDPYDHVVRERGRVSVRLLHERNITSTYK